MDDILVSEMKYPFFILIYLIVITMITRMYMNWVKI